MATAYHPAPQQKAAIQIQLRGLQARFAEERARGLGIYALFVGPCGTGKTLAGEVLSNELQLDLYHIDLSAIVNKYIGETEKNLRRLFDATEKGGAILLFDEADALFGKRSEVKDSHDYYANLEVSYLLQRMETYGGLAVLTTNCRTISRSSFTAPQQKAAAQITLFDTHKRSITVSTVRSTNKRILAKLLRAGVFNSTQHALNKALFQGRKKT